LVGVRGTACFPSLCAPSRPLSSKHQQVAPPPIRVSVVCRANPTPGPDTHASSAANTWSQGSTTPQSLSRSPGRKSHSSRLSRNSTSAVPKDKSRDKDKETEAEDADETRTCTTANGAGSSTGLAQTQDPVSAPAPAPAPAATPAPAPAHAPGAGSAIDPLSQVSVDELPLATGLANTGMCLLPPGHLYAKESRTDDPPTINPDGRGARPRELGIVEKCGAHG
jgi:hypothetical protein